jgi:hypothetical protein
LKRIEEEAEAIWRGNWGYVPLDREELASMFRQLKPIADPDATWMVEDAGRAVGYALGFPDLNILLRRIRGRLLPFGFLTLRHQGARPHPGIGDPPVPGSGASRPPGVHRAHQGLRGPDHPGGRQQ